MRITPDIKYKGQPCSYTSTGCAYEDVIKEPFTKPLPDELKENGYLSLDSANKYIRQYLPVKKKQYFKQGERMTLENFMKDNEQKCCVCVYGHFIYVDGKNYWSFFDNEDDDVICVWYLKDAK